MPTNISVGTLESPPPSDSADAHSKLAGGYLADGQKAWLANLLKKHWPCWILMRRQRLHGLIPSRGAVRFVATCSGHSRKRYKEPDN